MTEKLPVNLQLNKMQQPKSIKFGNTASTIPVQKDEDEAEKKRKEGLMVATLVGLATAAVAGTIYYNGHPGKWQEHTGKVKDFFKGNKGKEGSSLHDSVAEHHVSASGNTPSVVYKLENHPKHAQIAEFAEGKNPNQILGDVKLTTNKDGWIEVSPLYGDENSLITLTDKMGKIVGTKQKVAAYENTYELTMNGYTGVDKMHRPYTERVCEAPKTVGCEGYTEYLRTYVDATKDVSKSTVTSEWRRVDSQGKLVERHLVKKRPGGKSVVKVQKYNDEGQKIASYTAEGGSLEAINNVTKADKLSKVKIYDIVDSRKTVYSDVRDASGAAKGYIQESYSYKHGDKGKLLDRALCWQATDGNMQKFELTKGADSYDSLSDHLKASIKYYWGEEASASLKLDDRSEGELAYIYSRVKSNLIADATEEIERVVASLEYAENLKRKTVEDLVEELTLHQAGVIGAKNKALQKEMDKLLIMLQSRGTVKGAKGTFNFSKLDTAGVFGKYKSEISERELKARVQEYLVCLQEQLSSNKGKYNDIPALMGSKKDRVLPEFVKVNSDSCIPASKRLHYGSDAYGSPFGFGATTFVDSKGVGGITPSSVTAYVTPWNPYDGTCYSGLVDKNGRKAIKTTTLENLCLINDRYSVAYPTQEMGLAHLSTVTTSDGKALRYNK